MVASITAANTPTARRHRARSTKRNWARVIRFRAGAGEKSPLARFGSSEHTFLYVDYVLILHVLVERRARFLDLAAGIAAMQHNAPACPLARDASAVGERLHDRHTLLQTVAARPLQLAIDIEHRSAVDEQCIASPQFDVIGRSSVQRHADDIYFAPKRFAISRACYDDHVRTRGSDTPRLGQHSG